MSVAIPKQKATDIIKIMVEVVWTHFHSKSVIYPFLLIKLIPISFHNFLQIADFSTLAETIYRVWHPLSPTKVKAISSHESIRPLSYGGV